MYEREVMEQNLAKLLGQEQTYNQIPLPSNTEEDPINPFQKRLFDKKLKRSTVSENKYNIRHTSTISCNLNDDYVQQIDHIFTQSQVELQKVRRKVLDHVQKIDEVQKFYKMKQIMDNLKETMNYVCQYAQKNAIEKTSKDYKQFKEYSKENKQNNDYNKRSTFYLQTYQCNDKSLQSIEPDENKNYYVERKGKNKKKQNKSTKRNISSGCMISNNKKSIYQSVLEERQLRKSKKKMI